MYRKILSWAFIVLGTLFLILSIVGIAAIWVYRVPLTHQAIGKLEQVDSELTQAQSALDNGKAELQRTLRIVDAAEKSLSSLKAELSSAKALTDQANGALTGTIIPGLQSTRGKVDQLRGTLEGLRNDLKKLNSIPFLNLNLPGDAFLSDLINSEDSLDKEISSVVQLTQKASTFTGDASYLLGGNLTETKQRVQNLLNLISEYDTKVKGWHAEVRSLIAHLPGWINEAAVGLTLFLIWFAISQFGLLLHGLALRQGADILVPLRRQEREHVRYMD